MKSSRGILAAAALAAVLAWPAAAQEKGHPEKKVSERQSESITATVEAIDSAKRELTLKGPKGNYVVMECPDSVKRFNEIKVGDQITVKYMEALVLEVHKADSAAKLGTTGTMGVERMKSEKPAATVSRQVTATVAVEAVDMAAPSITVKNAEGNTLSFRVKDKKKLEGVHPGDKLVITYSEAVAMQVSTPPAK
jgi:Cu/Ag efflux protein CusF